MSGSPADAISHAIERSKQSLFPLNANKWFALGFTVFLAQCGEAGTSMQVPSWPGGTSGSGGAGPAADVADQIQSGLRTLTDNLELTIAIGVSTLVVLVILGVLFTWISSRARLMFVESVIWDRVDVGAQWTRAGELGTSLMKVRLVLGFTGALLALAGVASALAVGFNAFMAGQFLAPRALAAYAVFGSMWLLLGIPFAIFSAILDDFVVPFMVLRNVHVRAAWEMCRKEVLANNFGGVSLFYLLRIVIAFVVSIVAGVLTCVTCCLVAIPYIGTVLLLPVHVFSRAYPLYYMEQLGIRVFPLPEPEWAAQERWRFPQ